MTRGQGSARSPWLVLAVTSLGAFVAFLDVTIVNIAFPAISESFPEASLADLSWVLNGYNVVFAALLLPAGKLSDLYGRRRLFVIGVAWFTLASALCGLAPSALALIAMRVVQAAGAAILVATCLAVILPVFPAERRATAVGLFGAVVALAAATGPALGGALIDASGWRIIFFVNVPVGVATVVLARVVISESRDPAATGLPDPLGIALGTVGAGLLALGIVQGNEWGWSSVEVLGALAGSVIVLAAFVWRCATQARPVLDLSLFRLAAVAAANGGTFIYAAGFYALLLCNVLFLTQVWGYSTLTAGLALTAGPLASTIAAVPAGRVADRVGERAVIVPGALIFAGGAALFVFGVGRDPAFAAEFLPAQILVGTGTGLAFPALASAAVGALPSAQFGIGSALNAASRQFGAVLGIAILVAVIDEPTPAEAAAAFDRGWILVGVAGLATLPTALLIGPRPAKAGRPVAREREAAPAPAALATRCRTLSKEIVDWMYDYLEVNPVPAVRAERMRMAEPSRDGWSSELREAYLEAFGGEVHVLVGDLRRQELIDGGEAVALDNPRHENDIVGVVAGRLRDLGLTLGA